MRSAMSSNWRRRRRRHVIDYIKKFYFYIQWKIKQKMWVLLLYQILTNAGREQSLTDQDLKVWWMTPCLYQKNHFLYLTWLTWQKLNNAYLEYLSKNMCMYWFSFGDNQTANNNRNQTALTLPLILKSLLPLWKNKDFKNVLVTATCSQWRRGGEKTTHLWYQLSSQG